MEFTSLAQYRWVFDVNFFGLVEVTRACVLCLCLTLTLPSTKAHTRCNFYSAQAFLHHAPTAHTRSNVIAAQAFLRLLRLCKGRIIMNTSVAGIFGPVSVSFLVIVYSAPP